MNRREETLIREYVREQLREELLSEGISDIFRNGAQKLITKIESIMSALVKMNTTSDAVINTLKKNDGADVVSKIDSLGAEFESSIDAAIESVPSVKKETRDRSDYRSTSYGLGLIHSRAPLTLNEVGVFESVGLILAAIGGIPLILNSLSKLASFMKMPKAASKIEKAYKMAHHFEEDVIDYVIPDKAVYAVYMMFEESHQPDRVANLKLFMDDPSKKIDGDRSMTLKEFNKSDVRKKYEKRIYALMLLPWIISGLSSIHHMMNNWIGAVEGAATAEKTLFAGSEAANLIKSIAQEFTTVASTVSKTV